MDDARHRPHEVATVRPDPVPGEGSGPSRLSLVVYFGGAVLLAPWIVVLGLTQEPDADGFHLRITSWGMSGFVIAGLLTTGLTSYRRRPATAVWAASTATFVFIAAYFNTITARHGPFAEALTYDVLVKAPAVVVCLWLAVRTAGDRGDHRAVPRWVPPVLVTAAVVLVPWFLTVSSYIRRTDELHNLEVFWVGLDLFELAGMLATGWLLVRRSPVAVVAATITGTLMFSDAWFNVVTTVHLAHRSALGMALVELPLAVYSLAVAGHEVDSWPPVDAHPRR